MNKLLQSDEDSGFNPKEAEAQVDTVIDIDSSKKPAWANTSGNDTIKLGKDPLSQFIKWTTENPDDAMAMAKKQSAVTAAKAPITSPAIRPAPRDSAADDSRTYLKRYRSSIDLKHADKNISFLTQPLHTQMAATEALALQNDWKQNQKKMAPYAVVNTNSVPLKTKIRVANPITHRQIETQVLLMGALTAFITSLLLLFPQWPWVEHNEFLLKHSWLMNSFALFSVYMMLFIGAQTIFAKIQAKKMAEEEDLINEQRQKNEKLTEAIWYKKSINDDNWIP